MASSTYLDVNRSPAAAIAKASLITSGWDLLILSCV